MGKHGYNMLITDPDMLARLDQEAKKERRTLRNLILLIIEDWLEGRETD